MSAKRPTIRVELTNNLLAYLGGQARTGDTDIGALLTGHALAYMVNAALAEGDYAAARHIWRLWRELNPDQCPPIDWAEFGELAL